MIPNTINAGDTLSFTESVADYAPEDGWALSYVLAYIANRVTISSTDNGDGTHLVAETAANTANYTPGEYSWQSYVTKGTERFAVHQGAVTIEANLAVGTADTRTHVKKTLDAIESLIEGKAGKDVDSYSIQGRSLSKMNITELLEWHNKYLELYRREKIADKVNQGLGTGNKILVRFL